MSNELIEYERPFYILEAIYLSSSNFTSKFIQSFEYRLAKNVLIWSIIDDAIAYDCLKYKNDKSLPEYLVRLLRLSETINNLIETIINDFYNFSEIYLEIDSSKFIPYPALKDIFIHHYRYYFENKKNQTDSKEIILEKYIKTIEKFEDASQGKFIVNIETPIRKLLEQNPPILFKSTFALPIISKHLFKSGNNRINETKIKEIVTFLSVNKMCKLSYNEIVSFLMNKLNININKILWTGKKTDAFRFKDFLKMSVSEFNSNFYFKDNKKLQNNHKSISGWSELTDFLSKINK